jgi:hypothetical protein
MAVTTVCCATIELSSGDSIVSLQERELDCAAERLSNNLVMMVATTMLTTVRTIDTGKGV